MHVVSSRPLLTSVQEFTYKDLTARDHPYFSGVLSSLLERWKSDTRLLEPSGITGWLSLFRKACTHPQPSKQRHYREMSP